MQEVFDFVLSHYEAILSVVTLIVSIVVFILRKKPVDSIMTAIYLAAVEAINFSEATDLKGVEKLRYCVGMVEASLKRTYPGINPITYYGYIVDVIEGILSTPQKKGDSK